MLPLLVSHLKALHAIGRSMDDAGRALAGGIGLGSKLRRSSAEPDADGRTIAASAPKETIDRTGRVAVVRNEPAQGGLASARLTPFVAATFNVAEGLVTAEQGSGV